MTPMSFDVTSSPIGNPECRRWRAPRPGCRLLPGADSGGSLRRTGRARQGARPAQANLRRREQPGVLARSEASAEGTMPAGDPCGRRHELPQVGSSSQDAARRPPSAEAISPMARPGQDDCNGHQWPHRGITAASSQHNATKPQRRSRFQSRSPAGLEWSTFANGSNAGRRRRSLGWLDEVATGVRPAPIGNPDFGVADLPQQEVAHARSQQFGSTGPGRACRPYGGAVRWSPR